MEDANNRKNRFEIIPANSDDGKSLRIIIIRTGVECALFTNTSHLGVRKRQTDICM